MKTLSLALRSVGFAAAFLLVAASSTQAANPKVTTDTSETKIDERFLEDYHSRKFDLRFQYPTYWTLSERYFPQDSAPDVAKHQVFLTQPTGGVLVMTVFTSMPNLRAWVERFHKTDIDDGSIDFRESRATISGKRALAWNSPSSGHDVASTTLVFQGRSYLYVIAFPTLEVEADGVDTLLKTIVTGSGGRTRIPEGVINSIGNLTKVASCSSCVDVDSFNNTYGCCTTKGNCTWKSEQVRSGNDNFIFGGSGRDAYKWMSLAKSFTSNMYAQGGTIPVVGAVLVATNSVGGGLGHVGTVKAIASDGSIVLTEQNCDNTCTRDQPYTKAWLRTNLAGYIYSGATPPAPLAKTINSTGETIIEDYPYNTSTSSFYFGTYGPGCPMSLNSGERMWGTSSSGLGDFMHFICSKTGTSENYGRWRAYVRTAGLYEIRAWIPTSTTYVTATSVKYEVNGVLSQAINQSTNRGAWIKVSNPGRSDGYWNFAIADRYNIYLRDTDNGTAGQFIAFDDLKFIRR